VALSPPLSPLIIKGFPHEISTPQQLTKQRKKKKKRNTRRLCLRHARFYFTTGEKSENDARDANERRRSCAFLLVASSQQQRLFDFVRVIISFAFSLNRFLRCVFWKKEREREREGKTKKKGRSRARLFFLNLKRLLFFTFAIDRASTLLTLARFFYFTHHTLFLCSFLRNEKKTKQDLYFRRFRVAVKFEER
jgi:hypothetical protein